MIIVYGESVLKQTERYDWKVIQISEHFSP